LKFTVTIKELDKELIQELINKHEKALTDVGDEDFKATLSDEELDELRELLRVAEELDTIDLVLPLNEDDFNKLKKFMETNSKLGVGSGSGSGGFSDLKKLVSGEDETKLREFILANSKLQELKMYRPLLDSETVNKLKDLVEKKSNGSSGNLEEELNLISKQEEAIEKELLNTPMIREDSYSSDNTKDSSKLIENIKNNIQILNSNMNPFNDVLTLLSIDTNLRNKIKNYLENPTDEGLLSMKESIAEDEQAAEDVVNYLRIFLGYELHALDDESIPINVRLDVLSVFDFGTFVRNPEKEFSEILGLLEEFMLNRSTMDDYVSMLDTKLVGNREPIDFALSDSYKYLAGLVNSRIKNASSPYTGFQGDDIIPEQFIYFMEDKKTIFYHICLYNVGENISLKRIDDSFALEKTWKEGSMIPLNFFIVRFLQLLKSKFES
jgi:hypothetical protein